MGRWLQWFLLTGLAAWIGYYRRYTSQLIRTRTAGLTHISTSLENNTESYQFFNQREQEKNSYFEFENIIYANGLCGNLQIPPKQRACTPPLHIHTNQTEYFTLVQGHLAYQIGNQFFSCDIQTCSKPLIIPPYVPHTFWMHDNKEDLIVRIRLEPASKDRGLRRAFFENYGGIFRDHYLSILQLFVLFDNAQTYPADFPLSIAKIIVKFGAWLGRLHGYKYEYDEYTTIAKRSN